MPICDLVLRFFGTYSGTLCRSGPCILRYLWCYARPIWSLYSSIFMVIHWADLVPVFFDTYRNILYRSDISEQDAQSASIPACFFLSVGSVSQRKVASPSPSTPQKPPPPTASPTDQFHLPLASLYTSNKKAPVPSKYNTARHQSKKNKCQAGIHNPLRYLLITE